MEKGLYDELLNKGLISIKIDYWLKIYESYEANLLDCETRLDALTFTADEHRVSEGTVYNAIKFFRL